jgi:microcystin-dependent protein
MPVTSTVATNQATTATNQNTGGDAAHNTIQPSIVKLFVIKYTPVAGSLDTLTKGTSISGYWSSAPSGYLMEDGTAVSRTTYSALFAIIGTTYGAGDGSTTFNLPDSRGRVSVNLNLSDAEFAAIGQKYGEKLHTVAVNEMASHTHIQNAHNHTQDAHSHSAPTTNGISGAGYETPTASTTGYDFGPAMPVTSTAATNQAATATNQNTGGGGSHNNIQPSIVQNFAIRY